MTGDDSRVDTARAGFPVVADCVYLNTASVGAVSTIYRDTLERATSQELSEGRASTAHFTQLGQARDALKVELAQILAVEADRLMLTQSTTSGIEYIVDGLRWEAGDEVICTDLEHDACRLTLERAARRNRLNLRVAAVTPDEPSDVEVIARLVTPRTRLIAFSETTYESGIRLPVKKIVSIAKSAGAATLIDAAQAVGAVALELGASGVDFCAMPLQKWLAGPEGLGALYVGAGSEDLLVDGLCDRIAHGIPILAAVRAQLEWQRTELGWDWTHERIARLTSHARHALGAVPESRLLSSGDAAGLTSLVFEGVDTGRIADELQKRRFVVRHFPELDAFRIATACFNTPQEIDALAEALTELVEEQS